MTSRSLLGVGVVFVLFGGVVAACGTESATIASADGGAEASSSSPDGSSTPDDASVGEDQDGEVVTDGGGVIDLDAGEEDGGLDAGPCNTLANDAPAIDSDCISVMPILGGGALVAGTYDLKAVRLLAPAKFCQNQFQKVSFKETMVMTVDGNGVGTANVVAQVANGPTRTRTTTLDPPANNNSPLVATPTCPPQSGGNSPYASEIRNGKQVLILRGAYGNGRADFHFEKK